MPSSADSDHFSNDGKRCDAEPGQWKPIIDHGRCEGKRDCIDVRPYGVFEVRRMDNTDFRQLSTLNKLKVVAHRRQTAYTPHADACRACGLCVAACPESAITLVGPLTTPTYSP